MSNILSLRTKIIRVVPKNSFAWNTCNLLSVSFWQGFRLISVKCPPPLMVTFLKLFPSRALLLSATVVWPLSNVIWPPFPMVILETEVRTLTCQSKIKSKAGHQYIVVEENDDQTHLLFWGILVVRTLNVFLCRRGRGFTTLDQVLH